ncbi:MAG: hypothetical protein JXA25_18090 [Anaerolineales bacterium]|nr:hypothetical protein [Anaerolineales bacterium]
MAIVSGPRKRSSFSLVAHAREKQVYPAVLDVLCSIVRLVMVSSLAALFSNGLRPSCFFLFSGFSIIHLLGFLAAGVNTALFSLFCRPNMRIVSGKEHVFSSSTSGQAIFPNYIYFRSIPS